METTRLSISSTQTYAKQNTLVSLGRQMRRSWQLYLLLALPLAWLIVFQYYPMYGAQIAFRDFLPGDNMWHARWVGLANFQRFFQSVMFTRLLGNTLGLSIYSLALGFPIPI